MKFSDIVKKGYGEPTAADLTVDGSIGIDIENQKAYSRDRNGAIFQIGSTVEDIVEDPLLANAMTPIGGIIMYYGQPANLPNNWALCNGSDNRAPNLTGKFMRVGSSNATPLATGGYADSVNVSHNHTSPKHTHTASTGGEGAHTHKYQNWTTVGGVGIGGNSAGLGYKTETTTNNPSDHTHSVTVNDWTTTVNYSGVSGTNRNIPPYFDILYIMRIY